MPRFTLSDLFLATTLIAVGVFGLCLAFRTDDPMAALALAPASAASCGAGIGAIFQRKAIWALIGIGILVVVCMALQSANVPVIHE